MVCAGKVIIWDIETGSVINQFEPEGRLETAFSPTDTTLFATGSNQGASPSAIYLVELWNLSTGEVIHRLRVDAGIRDMTFSSDGTQLLIAQADGAIRVLNVDSFVVASALSHSNVHRIDFINGGERLMSVNGDDIRLWDWSTGQQVDTYSIPYSVYEDDLVITDNLLINEDIEVREGRVYTRVIAVRDIADGTTIARSSDGSEPAFGLLIHNIQLSQIVPGLVFWIDDRLTLNVWNYKTNSTVMEVDLLQYMHPRPPTY